MKTDGPQDAAREVQQLAAQQIGKAIGCLSVLIDSPNGSVALEACRTILQYATGCPIQQSGTADYDVDRVYPGDNFNRGGIGDDRLFEAKLSEKDVELLRKMAEGARETEGPESGSTGS